MIPGFDGEKGYGVETSSEPLADSSDQCGTSKVVFWFILRVGQ